MEELTAAARNKAGADFFKVKKRNTYYGEIKRARIRCMPTLLPGYQN
jgi:hypothetical protein